MPGVTWSAETDRKLFLFFLKDSAVKLDYEAAAAAMSTPEVTCTPNAVESRIKKLRVLARKDFEAAESKKPANDNDEPAVTAKAKGGKKGDEKGDKKGDKKTVKKPNKKGGKRAVPVAADEDSDADDYAIITAPRATKRVRRSTAAATPKAEIAVEEDAKNAIASPVEDASDGQTLETKGKDQTVKDNPVTVEITKEEGTRG